MGAPWPMPYNARRGGVEVNGQAARPGCGWFGHAGAGGGTLDRPHAPAVAGPQRLGLCWASRPQSHPGWLRPAPAGAGERADRCPQPLGPPCGVELGATPRWQPPLGGTSPDMME